MRLSLEELGFFSIFIAFNLYMIAIIEGVVPKLFFLGWTICILGAAIYILLKKDEEDIKDNVPRMLEWDIYA